MSRILYLCNVDWNWIKQRPQFIAEELSKTNEVICITPYWYNRKKLQKRNNNVEIKFIEFYGVPKAKDYYCIRKLNNKLRSAITRYCIKKLTPDIIYVTHPEQYFHAMKNTESKIVYDCMDDHVALAKDIKAKEDIAIAEDNLLSVADKVIVTSENLCNTISSKYGIHKDRMQIIRNGFSKDSIVDFLDQEEKHQNSDQFHIAYIGTVSSWFDLDSIVDSLKRKNVVYHIFGPIQLDIKLPNNSHIVYEGIIEHSELFDSIMNFDALIMPFIVNDIVASVDPVKLYEYVNFNKPIISVYYDEIKRFEPFVWFYGKDDITLDHAIENCMKNGKKYSSEERTALLLQSTWESRASEIQLYLDN